MVASTKRHQQQQQRNQGALTASIIWTAGAESPARLSSRIIITPVLIAEQRAACSVSVPQRPKPKPKPKPKPQPLDYLSTQLPNNNPLYLTISPPSISLTDQSPHRNAAP
jgi:hypothetical protein